MCTLQLRESTILSYKRSAFPPIRKYHEAMGVSSYSEALTSEFIELQRDRLNSGGISARHFRKLSKAGSLLCEFNKTGKLVWKTTTRAKPPNNPYFKQICILFLSSLNGFIAEGTINVIKSVITSFLFYLEDIGHKDFKEISLTDIQSFLIKVSCKNSRGMGNILFALRRFWKYLNENGAATLDVSTVLIKPAGPFKKVLPCFSKEEARALLSQIQDGGAKGCRDYAILLLALHTGLRLIDIVHLKLEDVDWQKKEIKYRTAQDW